MDQKPPPKETWLTDNLCRMLATDLRFLGRFQQLKTYERQVADTDKAVKSGQCIACANVVKHEDIWASVRARVNGFPALDKRDLLQMLGADKLHIQLGGLIKTINAAPPPT